MSQSTKTQNSIYKTESCLFPYPSPKETGHQNGRESQLYTKHTAIKPFELTKMWIAFAAFFYYFLQVL